MSEETTKIRIRVRCEDRLIVSLASPGQSARRIPTKLTPAKLASFNESFYRELEAFRHLVRYEDPQPGRVDLQPKFIVGAEAISLLYRIGTSLSFQIFGMRQAEVARFFSDTVPAWRRSSEISYVPPLIKVESRLEYLLPFEFLPLFDCTRPPPIQSDRDLWSIAARFLGFSTIIQRAVIRNEDEQDREQLESKYKDEDDQEELLENSSTLRLRLFQHAGLRGALDELNFFSSAGWADLRGPWPQQLLDPVKFTQELADQLWTARQVDADGSLEAPDHIQHFACHCNTDRESHQDYAILLAHQKDSWLDRTLGRSSQQCATIRDFLQQFGGYAAGERPADARPLIVFNACGSSRLTAAGVTSFPDLFLEIGNRGVIGTETRIPDLFAADFCKKFYWLFVTTASLGQSMYQTRWLFLKKCNPLGILYTIYANPHLKVSRKFIRAINKRDDVGQ